MRSDWSEAIADYSKLLPGELRPRVVAHHRDALATFLHWVEGEDLPLEDFRLKHLLAFLGHRSSLLEAKGKEGLSEHTKANYKKVLRRFLAFCYEDGRVEKNPLAGLKVPAPPQADVFVPTAEDLTRLLEVLRNHWRAPVKVGHVFMKDREKRFYYRHNFALLALLIDTGCRISEALGVLPEDLNLSGGEPTVAIRKQKGGGRRTLPLSRYAVSALETYLAVRPKGTPNNPVDPQLFLTVAGTAYSYASANWRLCQYRKQANLPRFTLHSLRHYALTAMAEVDLWAAQGIAGHKSPRTTQIYAHSRGKHLRESHQKANPLGQVVGDSPQSLPSRRTKRV